MEIDKLKISEGDFDLFVELEPKQKLEFLWDAQYVGLEASILKQLDRLDELDEIRDHIEPEPILKPNNINDTGNGVCITIYQDMLYLNSASLKSIKQFINKLWLEGHILCRTDAKKGKYDIYRYFRSYQVIGKGMPLSEN